MNTRPPNREEYIDLAGTLLGIAELVAPAEDGWQPEMHVEHVTGTDHVMRMWFGPEPAAIYRLTVEVEDDE